METENPKYTIVQISPKRYQVAESWMTSNVNGGPMLTTYRLHDRKFKNHREAYVYVCELLVAG
jgi:hypothetical protein